MTNYRKALTSVLYLSVEHKRKVKEYRKSQKKEKPDKSRTEHEPTQITDDELWARLDQLEDIETKRREIAKLG